MISTITPQQIDTKVSIHALTDGKRTDWDAYVQAAPNGLPMHLSSWQTIMYRTYAYNTKFLYAQQANEIVGVLPLFFVPSRITGRRAMTLPGALCAQNDAVANALIQAGLETAVSHKLNRLVLQDSRRAWPVPGNTTNQHVHWVLGLEPSEDDLWRRLDGNMRRQVRKARKNGLTVEVNRTAKLLDPFYDVFSRFTHTAGAPIFGRSFLENIVQTLPDNFNIAVVRYEKQAIAAYFQLEMNQTVYGMWGAALHETINLRPAYLALWEIMADAIRHGFTTLDMGRSPANSNASKFKGQWGGRAFPVYQQIMRIGAAKDESITHQLQTDGKMQWFMRMWPRLPLSMTRTIGPRLRWHVPFA